MKRMKQMSKLVVMSIMVVMVLMIAGCGSSESDNFTGKWITKNPKTNVTILDIQPEKDKKVVIKETVYGYQDKITKKSMKPFTNEDHLKYLNTLTKVENNINAIVNKKELVTQDGTYTFNEQDKTIIINNVVYSKYANDSELNNKIGELKKSKEESIKNRTKNDNMFKTYYDKFDYDDSALTK